jgi:O-antigen ligase
MNFLFFILLLLPYGFLAWKRTDWALMLLIAALPTYVIRTDIFGIPTTLLEGMILICFGVWFLANAKDISKRIRLRLRGKTELLPASMKISRYPFDIEIVLVLLVSFFAMWVSGFSNSAMGIWKAYFFEPLLVFLLVFNVFFAERRKEDSSTEFLHRSWAKIILPLSVSALLVSLFAIYQKLSGNFIPNPLWANASTRRVTSFFGYPNAVGLYLGPIVILVAGYLLSVASKYRQKCKDRVKCENWSPFSLTWFFALPFRKKVPILLLKASLVCSLLAIYFAKSDGALIAIALAGGLIAFFYEPLTRIGVLRSFLVFVIGSAIIVIIMTPSLGQSVSKHLRLEDFSGQVRKAQWQETGIMLRDGHWFLGAGLSAYRSAIEPYHAPGIYLHTDNPDHEELIAKSPEYQAKYWQPLEIFMYPHNIFLNFWVELGFLGLLLFLWIILKFIYKSFLEIFMLNDPARRILAISLAATMFGVVVHGIVDVPYFKNDLSLLFWLIIALLGLLEFSKNFPKELD